MRVPSFAASILLLGSVVAESTVTVFACDSSAASQVGAVLATATSSPLAKVAAVNSANSSSSVSTSAATTVVVYSTLTVVPVPLNTSTTSAASASQTCFLTTISGVPRGVCQAVTGSVPYPTGTGVYHNYTAIGTGHYNRTRTSYLPGTGRPSATGFRTLSSSSASLFSSSSSSSLSTIVASSSTQPLKHTHSKSHKSSASPLPTTSSAAPSTFATSTSSSFVYSTSSTSSSPTSSSSTASDFLYGVNLGGWLVLEKWMDSDVFTGAFADATDEWSFSEIDGAEEALQQHWETFFTEDDIQTIAATGINALRIPIGYWAYNNTGTPYIQGADDYLEKAIGWARTYGMKVWVDCHDSPGSQNGFDNSGHAGDVSWQSEENLAASIEVLVTMATKYGSSEYADVVVGLEMTNEPISYGNNVFSVTQSWAATAYAAVKAVVQNENMVIVMHDAFEGSNAWTSIAGVLNTLGLSSPNAFGTDSHLYQLYTDEYNTYTQAEHIAAACDWSSDLAPQNEQFPVYVGEFSAATNICVNPDGSTTAGTSCSTDGCQCQSADFEDWNDDMKKQVRMFVEAQLDVFESSSSGYFMWAAKGPGGWGFLNGIEAGVIPNPVTSRQYPSQCSGLTR